ncbi:STAS-like domain-containing protein [Acetobacterium woodii]|uniref:Uncharacterized protein n=1 Tax=Acetobacterium woodii (strain ATCC 29683 / DSM 1030 / JCM 2381 / KCTC 1655 / WB1) TaxID=931626 RepID=H6LER3_ACEWD|nr:DUF4325 domain-containing protein [Acetobacterium woodii]AFA49356.1 hypothetical protein Awo_c26000 [Acetobacterium woodii DSM 1030]
MSFKKEKKERIENYILELIKNGNHEDVKQKTIYACDISPTTYYRYLKNLKDKNLIKEDKNNRYVLADVRKELFCYKNKGLYEHEIYENDIDQFIKTLPKNIQNIWYYAFTEIMNNAIEHSSANEIHVLVAETPLDIIIVISDEGIGIFNNIKSFIEETTGEEISLEDAMRQLFKGKFTTKSENHAGEGIFFTSRIMDLFMIASSGLFFSHDNYKDLEAKISDIVPNSTLLKKGTSVMMQLSKNSNKETRTIFNQFTTPDEGFFRTEIKLKNFCEHGYPVSRSQARRIFDGMNLFKEVTIDFEGVSDLGQAFCHEIFVVFQNKFPDIQIKAINANENVQGMISRIINTEKLLKKKVKN